MARRHGLGSAAAAFCALLVATDLPAFATDAGTKQHAVSLVGAPKFGPDFQHFDWVNPNAPKGGRVRQWALGSFNSLNPFPVKGSVAAGVTLIYDQLMSSSPDEETTAYGLIAEWTTHADDFSSATFQLRPEARFHDGKPITPEDVVFSLDAIKKASPNYAFYYKNVTKAEKTGEHRGHLPVRRPRQPRAAGDCR